MDKHELPPGWEWTTLDDSCEVVMGQSPPSSTYNTEGIGLPFYQGKAEFGDLYPSPVKWCSEPNKIAEANDILISVRAPVGPTNLCREQSCIGRGLAAVRPFENLEHLYFLHWLRYIEDDWESKSTGTTFKAISGATLRAQEIPLPPLPEQQRIVDEIEAQFTRLDAVVAALKRAQATLKRYRASVLKTACEGRLVPQDPADEPAAQLLERILAERRQQWNGRGSYQEPSPPLGGTEEGLPELPVGWVWASVEQVADVQTGATPLRKNKAYWENATVPWVTSAVVNNLFTDEASEFITELALKETNTKIFLAGSLLVAMYGEGKTRGKVSELRIDAATNQALAGLLFDGLAEQCKRFVKLFFQKNYEDIRLLSSGGVQPNLNLSLIRQTCVPLPPLAEQQRIVEEVERRLSVMDEVGASLEANLKRAERLRQSILKRAFAGKLVPQNPADEPASVLLERIREVKAKGSRQMGLPGVA